jgi:hypothetical protein
VVAFRSPTGSYLDLLEDDAVMAGVFIARLASDLVGLLMAKAEQGKSTISVPREVTNLGAVLVGA